MEEIKKTINLKKYVKKQNQKHNKNLSILLAISVLLFILKILNFTNLYNQIINFVFYSFTTILCGYIVWYIYIMLHNNLLIHKLEKSNVLEQINEELLRGEFNSVLKCSITDNYLINFEHLSVIKNKDITRMYIVPKFSYGAYGLISKNTLAVITKNKEYNIYNSNIDELYKMLDLLKKISKENNLNIKFQKASFYGMKFFIKVILISLISVPMIIAILIIMEKYIF